jgi:hypothetical protein
MAKEAAEKLCTEQEKIRLEQAGRVRALLLQGRRSNNPGASEPSIGFSSEAVQELETLKEKQ